MCERCFQSQDKGRPNADTIRKLPHDSNLASLDYGDIPGQEEYQRNDPIDYDEDGEISIVVNKCSKRQVSCPANLLLSPSPISSLVA